MTNFVTAQESKNDELKESQDLIAAGEVLYQQWNHQAALDRFQQADQRAPGNYEVVWKIARQYAKLGQKAPREQKENLYQQAMDWARKAVSLNANEAQGHLWLAIAEGRLAMFKGGKQKVSLSKEVKKEAELVIKLDPKNDIAYHILGVWHREVATLNMVLKVFAKIIYGGLPAADIQEGIKYLENSVRLKPDGIEHHLELGKTYLEVNRYNEARKEFSQCLALAIKEENDPQYKKEAEALLVKIQNK